MKGESSKLQSSWKGLYKVTRINDVVYRIQRNPRSKMMVYTWTNWHLIREPLRMSGLQEGAAGADG
jgi:hypothetical protein